MSCTWPTSSRRTPWRAFGVRWSTATVEIVKRGWAAPRDASLFQVRLFMLTLFFTFLKNSTTKLSNLFPFAEAFSSQAPRIVDTKPVVIVEEGKPVELGCLAHGHPLPSTTWYRHHHHHNHNQQQQPSSEVFESNTSPQMTQSPKVRQGTFWDSGGVSSGRSNSNRYRILSNSLLIEKTIASADSGVYRCIVNNNLGSEVAETTLVVRGKCSMQPFSKE